MAITISSAPRALSPTPRAAPSRRGRNDNCAPRIEPRNFDNDAIASTIRAHMIVSPSASKPRSTRRPAVAKKIGAKTAAVIVSSGRMSSCSAKRERARMTPAMKAPNTASTWSHWVTTPKESVVTSTTVIPESWSPPLARTRLSAVSTTRCPTVKATTKNTMSPTTVKASLSSLRPPACASRR